MSKSIIGFYHAPLTQQERDEMLSIMMPSMKLDIIMGIKYTIERQAQEFFEPFKGDCSTNLIPVVEMLNNRMHPWLMEYLNKYRDIRQLQDLDKYNVRFVDNGDITFLFSDGFVELFEDPNKLHMPERKYLPGDEYQQVDNVNRHLSQYPEDRIFDKTDQALLIDTINKAIINKLENHCYESQNSSVIYDFSQFSLDLIKGLNT